MWKSCFKVRGWFVDRGEVSHMQKKKKKHFVDIEISYWNKKTTQKRRENHAIAGCRECCFRILYSLEIHFYWNVQNLIVWRE